MKKLTSVILILLILSAFPVCIQAENGASTISDDVVELLNDQWDEYKLSRVLYYHNKKVDNTTEEKYPVIKIYNRLYLLWLNSTEKNISLAASGANGYYAAVLAPQPKVYYAVNGNDQIVMTTTPPQDNSIPSADKQFIKDIQNLQRTTTILGEECYIEEIICFYGSTAAYNDAVVGLVTDKGTFIKYYGIGEREIYTLKEDDFNQQVLEWHNYCNEYANVRAKYTNEHLHGGINLVDFSLYMRQKDNGTLKNLRGVRSRSNKSLFRSDSA